MLEYSCNTEISNLYLVSLSHENILSLKISMQDFSIMNMFDSQTHLNEPV
jgi:hypothetical protein